MFFNFQVLYPSSFYPHKNHSFLFHPLLVEYFQSKSISIILTIDPVCAPYSLSLCNCFSFVGPLSHSTVLDIYHHVDALLFPSLAESLGLPLIESVDHSLPIIASSLPVFQELLGCSYYSFDPYSVSSLISTLNNFLADRNRSALLKPVLAPAKFYSSDFIDLATKIFRP